MKRAGVALRRRWFAAVICLLLVACQPPGGDLLPIAQPGGTLSTSRFENDTAQITRDGVTVKAYGTWEGNSETSVTVVINNRSAADVRADVSRSTLVNNSDERGEIAYVREKKGGASEAIYNRYDASAYQPPTITAGGRRAFVINFRYPDKEQSRDVTSQAATLRVPMASAGDFEFAFRYVEPRVSRTTPDPVD